MLLFEMTISPQNLKQCELVNGKAISIPVGNDSGTMVEPWPSNRDVVGSISVALPLIYFPMLFTVRVPARRMDSASSQPMVNHVMGVIDTST